MFSDLSTNTYRTRRKPVLRLPALHPIRAFALQCGRIKNPF